MKKYFSIGEAAKAARTTKETLRHYDRIGLVKPSKKDEWTHYRYYTQQDIVRLNTVRALQLMGLPLQEIKKVLDFDDLEKIVAFLKQAEIQVDEKITALQYSKSKIQSAKADYETKLQVQQKSDRVFLKDYPERVILLSDTLETPALDNLWDYLSHFYSKVPSAVKEQFLFYDLAGIYTENGSSKLFAVCIQYADIPSLRILPKGEYLCADCTEENREAALHELIQEARITYSIEPKFTIQLVVVSGILRWDYQIQIPLC